MKTDVLISASSHALETLHTELFTDRRVKKCLEIFLPIRSDTFFAELKCVKMFFLKRVGVLGKRLITDRMVFFFFLIVQ